MYNLNMQIDFITFSFKVKSSQEMCTSSHVTKIAGLEEKLVRQAGMLEEVVDKVLVVIIILQMNMIIS